MSSDRFEILSGETLVGWTLFEFGDPPMGVAFGRFHPLIDLSEWQLPTDAETLPLHARNALGVELRPCSHVYLDGLAEDVDSLEVSICGLDGEVYEQHFPGHVRDYRARYSD